MAFAEMGVDTMGPLPIAPGNMCFTAVALEFFTKWIEAKALAKITSSTLISFMWQKIICWFRVPSCITVNNVKQFDCTEFRKFCSELGIKLAFASVNHPESNVAVERVRLDFQRSVQSVVRSAKREMGAGIDHLGLGHNNSRTRTTGFTPFRLLYDKEAITPEELKLASFHTEIAATTLIQRYVELEAVENARLHAASNLDKYHEEMKTW
jgi:transposase InsO family protein